MPSGEMRVTAFLLIHAACAVTDHEARPAHLASNDVYHDVCRDFYHNTATDMYWRTCVPVDISTDNIMTCMTVPARQATSRGPPGDMRTDMHSEIHNDESNDVSH